MGAYLSLSPMVGMPVQGAGSAKSALLAAREPPASAAAAAPAAGATCRRKLDLEAHEILSLLSKRCRLGPGGGDGLMSEGLGLGVLVHEFLSQAAV
jgi:hypothetical protein